MQKVHYADGLAATCAAQQPVLPALHVNSNIIIIFTIDQVFQIQTKQKI